MDKVYISAQQLLEDSTQMALQIFESGFRPDYIVGVWRGGAPVGISVQEVLDCLGVESDHIAIRTSSYTGIGERSRHIKVHGLTYLIKRLESEDSLLIVDDVHDSGLSIAQTILELKKACKKNTPEIRIATPYYKPANNKTGNVPDYYVHESNEWLVFPHELDGLSKEEILAHKPEFAAVAEKMAELGQFDK
ncbi:phosphoribosyltransferase [Neptuniibacter caesariensis]|uniref:Putative hypoxanthine-guanine phosphoribosyltransferase n=1 Tax=Neptuniibacter caesariensis TaxID=207954 RepID=A0A7U8C8V0_NEPCE|nr:phosphoribosyltransferase family protein [Neptuniibacter caesariensis]EAR61924.1 putative hypoxanthine-guanine phosphoribosyltransferase [Oceanospirillum sp. MED92] [Neptuniibacter caesariensis]